MATIKVEYEIGVDGYPGGGMQTFEVDLSEFEDMSRGAIEDALDAELERQVLKRARYHCEDFDSIIERIHEAVGEKAS